MSPGLRLTAYRYSVYSWAARWALAERGLDWEVIEADPFAGPEARAAIPHPFGRVPVLEHGGFRLFETQAILRYLDAAFPGPALTPSDPQAAARMAQAMGLADNYGYWPLVRQVFSHGAFRPASGEVADPAVLESGLADAAPVLAALEGIAAEGLVLAGPLSLADLLIGPMLDYFARVPAGAMALGQAPALAARLDLLATRPSFQSTRPALPLPQRPA